jgi:hypothetical protein
MSLFKQEKTVQEILDREMPKLKGILEGMFQKVNGGMGSVVASSATLAEVPLVLSMEDDDGGRYKLVDVKGGDGRIVAQLQLTLTIKVDDFI